MHTSSRGHRPTAGWTPRGRARCTRLVVTFSGEIDCSNVAEIGAVLRAKVLRAPPTTRVVVDCAELTFVDSLGLELMARLQQLADERDLLLTWRNLSPHVRNLVCLLALDRLLKMEPVADRAAAS